MEAAALTAAETATTAAVAAETGAAAAAAETGAAAAAAAVEGRDCARRAGRQAQGKLRPLELRIALLPPPVLCLVRLLAAAAL